MVRYCKNCGCELPDDSLFCDECGAKASGSLLNKNNALFGKYNIDMMGGEFIIRQSQIHEGCLILPGIVVGFGVFIGFLILIRMAGAIYVSPATAFFSIFNGLTIVGLIWLVIRYVAYKSNDLILTNKRVFGKCGIISTTQMQAPLNRIDSVSFKQGLMGSAIGYGTVLIATHSAAFKFRFVREGESLYNDIFNQLEATEIEGRNLDAKAIVDAMAEKLS